MLPRLLGDGDADVRILSCELARTLPGPEATRTAVHAARRANSEANVCAAAIDVLAEVGGPEALPALAALRSSGFATTPFLAFCDQDCDRPDQLAARRIRVPESAALNEEEFRRLVRLSLSTYRHGLHRSQALLRRAARGRADVGDRIAVRSRAISRGCAPMRRARSNSSSTRSPSTKPISIAKITSSNASPPICWRNESARQETGRAHPHLVRALLDRRGTVFGRHVAAGKLAAGR